MLSNGNRGWRWEGEERWEKGAGYYIPVMMTTLSWTRGLLEPGATLDMGGRR
jgi:hypothetical protein